MNNDAARKFGSYLSAAAVVLSLVFVGLEIRNNTIAMRGITMQAISDSSVSFFLSMSLDREFNELVVRVFDGEATDQFSSVETSQLRQNLTAFIRGLENTYLQQREGLVPDAVFESYGWNDAITRTVFFEEYWNNSVVGAVSPEFREFFESRVQIGPR